MEVRPTAPPRESEPPARTPAGPLRIRGLGRAGLGVLGLALALAWPAQREERRETGDAPTLHRVLERVETGAGVALATAPGGDVWWVTRDAAVRFASGDPARREVALDAALWRARLGRAPEPISAAHVDARGGLWLGTRGGAVLQLDGGRWRERSAPAGGPVRAIATRGSAVYAAGDGLWRGAIDAGELEALSPFGDVRVERLAAGPPGVALAAAGRVWLRRRGDWRVVWRTRPGGPTVSALALAPRGELWIGTSSGLVRVDRAGRARLELAGAHIDALDPAPGGSLAGTRGAGLFARYAGGWRRVDAAGDLGLRRVSELARAPEGALWLALGDRGLFRAGPTAPAPAHVSAR